MSRNNQNILLRLFWVGLPILGSVTLFPTTMTSSTTSLVNAFTVVSPVVVVPAKKSCHLYRQSRIRTTFVFSTESDNNTDSHHPTDKSKKEEEEEEEEQGVDKEMETTLTTDPNEELKAIKDEIAQLENNIKSKKRELASMEDLADQYTKAGYARKVAELDSFRKNKMAAQSDSKSVVKASILQDFLPVLEQLHTLDQQYAHDEFATRNYSALSSNFASALKAMGLVEFSPAVGSKVDLSKNRITVVQEEVSELYPDDGCILRTLKVGYELNGNIVRPAQVVASTAVKESSTD